MPLAVSDSACEVIKQLLDMAEAGPGRAIRLVPDGLGNFGFALDGWTESDQIVEYAGATIMVIESPISEDLSDYVLDAVRIPEGWTFSMRRDLGR